MNPNLPLDRPLLSARHLAHIVGLRVDALRELANAADRLYAPFTAKQVKNGKHKSRDIDNPLEPLKSVQRLIKKRLLDNVPMPHYMNGGVRNRSTQQNARNHIRQPELVTIDIKKFFPHVTNAQVAAVWRKVFGASKEVAWILTKLTTLQGHLPQGSPASTALANLVIAPVADEIFKKCTERGLCFSIYVDDIAISGRGAHHQISEVARALSRYGFPISRKKVQVMRAGVRQSVTGHVVNRRLSNGLDRIGQARLATFWALRIGATDEERARARGIVAHIYRTSQTQGRWLQNLLERKAPLKSLPRDTNGKRSGKTMNLGRRVALALRVAQRARFQGRCS